MDSPPVTPKPPIQLEIKNDDKTISPTDKLYQDALWLTGC